MKRLQKTFLFALFSLFLLSSCNNNPQINTFENELITKIEELVGVDNLNDLQLTDIANNASLVTTSDNSCSISEIAYEKSYWSFYSYSQVYIFNFASLFGKGNTINDLGLGNGSYTITQQLPHSEIDNSEPYLIIAKINYEEYPFFTEISPALQSNEEVQYNIELTDNDKLFAVLFVPAHYNNNLDINSFEIAQSDCGNETEIDYGNAVVKYEYLGGCFEYCPKYEVTLYGNGQVTYLEENSVDGEQSTTIPANEVHALVDYMLERNYLSFNDEYNDIVIQDAHYSSNSLTINGETKTIFLYHGDDSIPEELNDIEKQIKLVANTGAWLD